MQCTHAEIHHLYKCIFVGSCLVYNLTFYQLGGGVREKIEIYVPHINACIYNKAFHTVSGNVHLSEMHREDK